MEAVQFDQEQDSPVKEMPVSKGFLREVFLPAVVVLAIVLAGAGTGYKFAASGSGSQGETSGRKVQTAPGAEVTNGAVGIKDESTFSDSAQGILEAGGIDGEGSHHLVREGGPSQYVYLTSSVIDLDQFIGQKVEVWGETFAGEKAGWLMDVGLVKKIE